MEFLVNAPQRRDGLRRSLAQCPIFQRKCDPPAPAAPTPIGVTGAVL